MSIRLRLERGSIWFAYLVLMTVLTVLYVVVPPFKGYAGLINLIGLTSPIAIAVGIRMHRPKATLAWLLLLFGQSLYFAGDFYTYSYPDLLGGHVGFPSAGDAMYLFVYPLLVAGLLLLVRRRNPRGDKAAVIDSLILTVGFALLSWVFLIAPNVHLSGLSWLAKAVSVAYPVGDVLLLAAAIRLAVNAGRRVPAFYLLVASIVSLLATDCAYNYAILKGTYHHQLVYDIGWIAYLVLWGAAALHPSMRSLEEPVDEYTRLTRTRLLLLTLACLIAPSIRFWDEIHRPDVLVIVGASGVLFLLVVARMAGLVRKEERRTAHENALRRAGVRLSAIEGEGVHDAVIAAVREVISDDAARLRLVLCNHDHSVVAASSDPLPETVTFDADASGWLHSTLTQQISLPAPALPASVRETLQLDANGVTLFSPLTIREDVTGALIINTQRLLSSGELDSLRSLATHISLSLESAALTEDLHRQKSEARFRSLVAHASDMITVLDADGVVSYQSPSIERVLGYTVAETEGRRFDRLLARGDRPRLEQILNGHRDGFETISIECSLRHADGRWLQFEMHSTDLLHDEHVGGLVLNSRDISERKAFEEQLSHQAFHDPVTGLANRALFADRVGHALIATQRTGALVAVMFIDLDDFKTVNDSLGHQAGDNVLLEVARRLENAVRPSDTVARFGGDEFAILLDEVTSTDEAAMIADRVLAALEQPVELDRKEVYARASVGICMSDEDLRAQDAEELLRNADLAMYMAKRDSKGSYRLFEPTMHERVVERLELRAELQRALELDQFEVYYQPVVHLDHRADYGVEALLRWNHPERGQISPAQFIPLAEETGLIVPIGRWVIFEACQQGAILHERFPRRPPLTMSVNLSVKQLHSEGIVDDVRKALELTGIEPSTLVLEITETVMMADPDTASARLNELKGLGVRIAMDDFGTGYSSLSYLSRLPVDILKMDRSFLATGNTDSGLAAAIIAIGERLGLEVVAEGIEEPEQIGTLRDLGCELGQGFLFARPMPQPDLVSYLDDEDDELEAADGRASNAA
ncbi:MAG TPA: EAL domain-containing protein [Gaiellaceae bacterium]|nr:EAL domain-containing protein [Gaiellaceae bacterium]